MLTDHDTGNLFDDFDPPGRRGIFVDTNVWVRTHHKSQGYIWSKGSTSILELEFIWAYNYNAYLDERL